MKIYEAKLSGYTTIAEDTWMVRGKDFAEAGAKALKTAARKGKQYDHHVDLISLRLLGEEQE